MRLFGKSKSDKQANALAALGDTAMPTFPSNLGKVLAKLRDPDTSLDELSEAIAWDPGLVVRVLRTVNTAAYGLRNRVNDLPHAIHILGPKQVESLVLALVVGQALPRKPARGFDARRYWFTAARRAAIARELAGRLHPATQSLCFTGGLLQDLAVPLLTAARGDEYGEVLDEWHATPDSCLSALELQAFGWNHLDVGACVAQAWELPTDLIDTIRSHHPEIHDGSEVEPAISLVSLLRENPDTPGNEQLIEHAHSDFGIDSDDMIQILDQAQTQASELVEALV